MSKTQQNEKNRVVTPVFRVTFPWVFSPQPPREGFSTKAMYQVTAVFEPDKFSPEDKKRWVSMQKIADEASQKVFKRPLAKLPKNFKLPFRDGAEKEHLDGFGEGTVFVSLKSKFRPGIVASDGKTAVEDPEENPKAFYSGCYARASVTAFAYDNVGKGVSFWMQNLMFVKDGPRLDGRVDAADDFGEFGGETEEPVDDLL